jgi:2',3'-cyclic-nucleotide 2'-phosphodiesterase/3'-nucleotidase
VRDYNHESLLGSVADVMVLEGGAEIAFENAGGLRADLPEGNVTNGNILDALPFLNSLVICEMTGAQIREVIEQGLSLERGLIQASGLRATYDITKQNGQRLVELRIGGAPVNDTRVYRVATNSFIAQGGDLYQTFLQTKQTDTGTALSDLVIEYSRKHASSPARSPELVPVTIQRAAGVSGSER